MSKRALVIGIDYVGQPCELRGCANDARAWGKLLARLGFQVTSLIDCDEEPSGLPPTRANILRELMILITSPATTLFYVFAGHGSQRLDTTHDEADGRDEILCPVDFRRGQSISDDALRGLWQCLQPSKQLFAVHDCCHSGSGMDLKYELYDRGGSYWRFIPAEGNENASETPGHVLLLSGCKDSQTSAEIEVAVAGNSTERGALSVAAIAVLEKYTVSGSHSADGGEEVKVSVSTLLRETRERLREKKMTQVAQLSSGRLVSPRVAFLA